HARLPSCCRRRVYRSPCRSRAPSVSTSFLVDSSSIEVHALAEDAMIVGKHVIVCRTLCHRRQNLGEMPMPAANDVFEIMHTTRAMRRLKPDPVPDDLIRKILDAGIRAPNGGNTQKWRFLVVKDPEIKKRVQVHYKRAFDEIVGPRYRSSEAP